MLNEDNNEFVSFLASDMGQNIMANNRVSIHIETGNIFYQHFNTNKNFYSFLLAQQDESMAIIPKRFSYHYSFEKCVKNFLPSFSADDIKKFNLFSNKNSKFLLYKFNDWIESLQSAEKLYIHHTDKLQDSISLKIIEKRDRQFLVEKLIHGIEFNNLYETLIKKTPAIIDTVEKNYKILRLVYQSLFVDLVDAFIKYIHTLNADEIQQLDDNIKANGYGVKSLLEIESSYELLKIFQLFYYLNGRLPLTNGLMIIPDGEVPEGIEKVNLKLLYEMCIFYSIYVCFSKIFKVNISTLKSTISELYMNLSYETLSGARNVDFEAVLNLTSDIAFEITKASLANINRKEQEDIKTSENISNSFGFIGETEHQKFKKELDDDLSTDLEHKKIEHRYVEPQVQDAETIEVETKKQEEDFNDLKIKFGQIDNAETQQKKENETVDLVDDILDNDNPFNDTIEDIFIDGDLFDNTNNADMKIVADDILRDIKTSQEKIMSTTTTTSYHYQ